MAAVKELLRAEMTEHSVSVITLSVQRQRKITMSSRVISIR